MFNPYIRIVYPILHIHVDHYKVDREIRLKCRCVVLKYTIGFLTIGQSPREDVMSELKEYLTNTNIVEVGVEILPLHILEQMEIMVEVIMEWHLTKMGIEM